MSEPPKPSTTDAVWNHADQPSIHVVETVATATRREPTLMPPLHHHIDPEALDALLSSESNAVENGVRVSFEYDGIQVIAERDNGLEIRLDPVGTE